MKSEAGVVLDRRGYPLFNHYPEGRTVGSLPDSPLLWDVLWANRSEISGFAHSHPGNGFSSPSETDVTTFAAIEAALGMRLDWWILTEDGVTLTRWSAPDRYETYRVPTQAFPWVWTLKSLSRMDNKTIQNMGG